MGLRVFGLLPAVQAVSPAPDGGYPGGNTAEGQNALLSRTTGGYNTAVGYLSLLSDSTSSFNTAIGAGTLLANTGDQNTATGAGVLLSNTTGFVNTANGAFALFSNTSGFSNIAVGVDALFHNTTGNANVAVGNGALNNNTTAGDNTAIGFDALSGNTTGASNTAAGYAALANNTTGINNTGVGITTLVNKTAGDGNTAIGYSSLGNLISGNYNVAVAGGFNLSGGDFNIDIGNDGVNGDSGVIRIGSGCCQNSAFIAGIWGVNANGGATVYINSDGQLGTATSSARFKRDIHDMDKASEALFALKPVAFRYKKEIDPAGTSQLGLVAENVEKVNPDLIVRDKEGKPYSVRYDQVNAMLLNEFLKEHKAFIEEQHKVKELETMVAQQRKDFEAAVAQLKTQVQRVSAQLEVSKTAAQTVLNNQ